MVAFADVAQVVQLLQDGKYSPGQMFDWIIARVRVRVRLWLEDARRPENPLIERVAVALTILTLFLSQLSEIHYATNQGV